MPYKKSTIKKAVVKVEVTPSVNKYINITKHNIFTENGVCHPNETIELDDKYIESYPGLEIVQ